MTEQPHAFVFDTSDALCKDCSELWNSPVHAIAQARPAVASEGLRAALLELLEWHDAGARAGWFDNWLARARAALASDAGSVGALDVERLDLHAVASCIRQDCNHFDAAECIRTLAVYLEPQAASPTWNSGWLTHDAAADEGEK